MSPALRKLSLTVHISCSVGWIGSVGAFLVLSIAGLWSHDPEIVRSAYLSMNVIGQFLIVPLGVLALLTGLIQALGTPWGLFRYYWVLVKFALTIGATSLLLLHQFTAVVDAAKRVSETATGVMPNVGRLGPQLVGDAAFAVVILLGITAISIYKPWGRTIYGERILRPSQPTRTERMVSKVSLRTKIILAAATVFAIGFILLHLAGKGLGEH